MTLPDVFRETEQKFAAGTATKSPKVEGTGDEHAYQPEFVYRFGSFELWPDGTLVRGSVTVPLPPKELSVLRVLLGQAGRVVSANELRKAAWGSVHVSPDSLPRCISSLRTRFGSERTITTLYKRGYRFDFPVRVSDAGNGTSRLTLVSSQIDMGMQTGANSNSPTRNLPTWDENNGYAQASFEQNRSPENHKNSRLVILPFETAAGVPDLLGDKVAEESMLHLSQSRSAGVDVIAYDSVSNLLRRGATAVQVGRALSAEFAIAGKVVALPIHYRLRAEMFRVADLVQVWVQDFVIPRHRVDSGVTNVARSIGDHIRNSFSSTKLDMDDDFDRLPSGHREISQGEDADATCLAC